MGMYKCKVSMMAYSTEYELWETIRHRTTNANQENLMSVIVNEDCREGKIWLHNDKIN